MNKSVKRSAKMNYLRAEVEKWALLVIGRRVPASVTFDGIKVTIDSFDERLDEYAEENVERNRQPIRFGLMSQWKHGGTGYFVCAGNILEAAIEVAKAFMWCIENRTNQEEFDRTPIDDIEFKDEPRQYAFNF